MGKECIKKFPFINHKTRFFVYELYISEGNVIKAKLLTQEQTEKPVSANI